MSAQAAIPVESSPVAGTSAKPAFVLAATDDGGSLAIVEGVAHSLANLLGVPLRRCALSSLTAALEHWPGPALAVLEAPKPDHIGRRRLTGAAFAVAHRVTRPTLFVPRTLRSWRGLRRVLVPLDGSTATAVGSSMALKALSSPKTVATTMHVFDEDSVPAYWDNPFYDAQAWTSEFRARFVDRLFGNGFALRTGWDNATKQILEVAANEDVDMVVVVWSQRRPEDRPDGVAVELLAESPVPVLLVPSSFVEEKIAELSPVPLGSMPTQHGGE